MAIEKRIVRKCGCVDYKYTHDEGLYRLKWCKEHYRARLEELGYKYNEEADKNWADGCYGKV